MQFVKTNGSPNCDNNRKQVDRVVIHWVGVGDAKAAVTHFGKVTSGTSAHYVVEDDLIYEVVPENMVAYHSGNYAMNQRSIGIETSATPDRPATQKTLETLAWLVRKICNERNIPIMDSHIIPHSKVKATQCPGTVPINQVIDMAKAIGGDMSEIAKLQKQLDEAIKKKDENWNRGEVFREQLEKANAVIEDLKRQLEVSHSEVTNLISLVDKKNLEIEQLKLAQPESRGALAHLTLALQSALAGKWN